jgi:CubicO group peptidase (beta-lactamase class C family)
VYSNWTANRVPGAGYAPGTHRFLWTIVELVLPEGRFPPESQNGMEKTMNRKEFLLSIGALIAAPRFGFGQEAKPATPSTELNDAFEAIRKKYELPALAGAVVRSAGMLDLTAVGVRKLGTEVAVTKDDRWHLGSNTKMMTSVLAARLVEAGKLRWDSTLGDVFPKISFEKAPGANAITLTQLLSHRSGLPSNLNWDPYFGLKTPIRDQRLKALSEGVLRPLSSEPGKKYEYSNLGYVVAGAMIEAVTGKSWEDALREQVFSPLNMTSAGFGPTGTPGKNDQPWPHEENGKPASEKGPLDNPAAIGPAGTVHCSLADWGKFIGDQLRGGRGEKALLKPESYQLIQTAQPGGGDYGFGWVCLKRAWADGPALSHAGSNTMNFAVVWLAPKKDIALLACTNTGIKTAGRALDETVVALLKKNLS